MKNKYCRGMHLSERKFKQIIKLFSADIEAKKIALLVNVNEKRGGNVYTQIVKNCSAKELIPIIQRHTGTNSTVYSDEWKAYDGLMNFGYKKHHRVTHSKDVFANGRAHVN